MRPRQLCRRSFLARVAGGAVAAGGAAALIMETAAAHPISDNDPTDTVGNGRGTGQWPHSDTDQGRYSDTVGRAGRLGHFSDNDRGPGADPARHGRRVGDRDPGDPGNRLPAISDGDAGEYGDRAGRGRRPPRR